jgi:hypothetical protein
VAGLLLAAGLGGCGGYPGRAVPPGTVTGITLACAGPPGAAQRPVTVFAWSGGRIVTTQVAHSGAGGGHYRLSLAPGRYLIAAPRSSDGAQSVALHSGETVTLNFPNVCF